MSWHIGVAEKELKGILKKKPGFWLRHDAPILKSFCNLHAIGYSHSTWKHFVFVSDNLSTNNKYSVDQKHKIG